MIDDKSTAYLAIMSLMSNNSYYARTKTERNIFANLLQKGLVNKQLNTKYCYIISPQGLEESSPILQNFKHDFGNKNRITTKEVNEIIINAVFDLITPLRPLVKIPDLWNYLQTKKNNLPRKSFEKTLLDMHFQGDITLQSGFSINDTKDGITTLQGHSYYYIMIDA